MILQIVKLSSVKDIFHTIIIQVEELKQMILHINIRVEICCIVEYTLFKLVLQVKQILITVLYRYHYDKSMLNIFTHTRLYEKLFNKLSIESNHTRVKYANHLLKHQKI